MIFVIKSGEPTNNIASSSDDSSIIDPYFDTIQQFHGAHNLVHDELMKTLKDIHHMDWGSLELRGDKRFDENSDSS